MSMNQINNENLQYLTRKRTASVPFFSIIIPVYNVAPYLRECLDSMLAQEFSSWECICVDDGSTDGSGEILDEYAVRDARFRIVHQRNGGVSAARNRALDLVRGPWLWFIDGDDAIRPDALAWLHEVVTCHPQVDSIAFGACTGVEFSDVHWLPLSLAKEAFPSECVTSSSLSAHRQAAWSTVMRTSSLRFPPYTIGEDALFQVTAYFNHHQRVTISEALYFYRERPHSAVRGSVTFAKVRDLLTTEKQILRCIAAHQDMWREDGLVDFLRWKRDFVWFTFQKMFYRLPNQEMKPLIPLWCEVQQALFALHKVCPWRKGVWRVIQQTESPFLCKALIFWPQKLKECVRDCLYFLGLGDALCQLKKRVRKAPNML